MILRSSSQMQCTYFFLTDVCLMMLIPSDFYQLEESPFPQSGDAVTNTGFGKSVLSALVESENEISQSKNSSYDHALFRMSRDIKNAQLYQGQHGNMTPASPDVCDSNRRKDQLSTSDYETTNVYIINAEECDAQECIRHITNTNGTIYLMSYKDNSTLLPYRPIKFSKMRLLCRWRISVPEGFFMKVVLDYLPGFSCHDFHVRFWEPVSIECIPGYAPALRECFNGQEAPVYTLSNTVCVSVDPEKQGQSNVPWLIVHFESTRVSYRHILPIVYTSAVSGYVASFDGQPRPYAKRMSASRDVIPPKDHVMMISFPLLELDTYPEIIKDTKPKDTVTLTELASGTSLRLPYKFEAKVFPPHLYKSSLRVYFQTSGGDTNLGFKMLFSFHPAAKAPFRLESGLFDCSVAHYTSFKHHLECNLEPECQGGEDESECPFSHPPCNGSVGYKDKCFSLFQSHDNLTWIEAQSLCRERGGNLASLKTPGEREAVSQIFTYGRRHFLFYIGVRMPDASTVPKMYVNLWQWMDGTVAYDSSLASDEWEWYRPHDTCSFCHPSQVLQAQCLRRMCGTFSSSHKINHFLCEFGIHQLNEPHSIKVAATKNLWSKAMIICSSGHVTHDLLACEADSHCGTESSITLCNAPGRDVIPRFDCMNGDQSVHYSLVCDHRMDCVDGWDETFCHHMSGCPDRTCDNSQCIAFIHWCDNIPHCTDSSDEKPGCNQLFRYFPNMPEIRTPVVIDLDGRGSFSTRALGASESCPDTHFQCPGEYIYCLPLYLRCNDMYDCPGHEDELECQVYTCPGFYRCRASSICLHPDHICDGVMQCPKQDDEWMCSWNSTCPIGCRCQGLAFVCTKSFNAYIHTDLRYLNASGSGMMLQNLTTQFYLVHLVLASNNISDLPHMYFSNLLFLDLSNNQIVSVNFDVFFGLKNLRFLDLSGNSLKFFSGSRFSLGHQHLQTLILSKSDMHEFDSEVLSSFPTINVLNLSFSTLHTIGAHGFRHLPNLMTLDLQGSPVQLFPRNVFQNVHLLNYIKTDNYKLCCRETLPSYFKESRCHAPVDEISSCKDLLRSDLYRAALWIFAVLSLSGNTGCLVLKLLLQKNRPRSGFNVFVINLSVADLLMGVYLVMIGIADRVFRGSYLWNDVDWKESKACKLAGFLSLMSSEVSALIICLITLDRFITLRFPFAAFRFVRASATIVCVIIWALGLFLAAVPLLPVTSHWNFYSQTGICVPLPVTREYFEGLGYSFSVMIVLNFVLFLFVAVGQIFIYWSVHTNTMTSETTRKSQDLTIARRLISVAVSDFLCWFPIGLLGMLANRGTPIPGEVSVVMAIFVLPLNSALNPFLYTFNMLVEKRRKAEKAQILRRLESGIHMENPTMSSAAESNDTEARVASTGEVSSLPSRIRLESALRYLESRLDSGSLTYTDIVTYLESTCKERC